MGFLDQLKEGLAGKLGLGSGGNSFLEQAIGLINNPATGGLGGLIETFKSKGLGEFINSWVGTGENKLISPDQIQDALGADKVQQVAEEVGVSKEEASKKLSEILPQIIDRLTPNGNLPDMSKLEDGLRMLKDKFFAK